MIAKRVQEQRDRDSLFQRNLNYAKQLKNEKRRRHRDQKQLNKLISRSQRKWQDQIQTRKSLQQYHDDQNRSEPKFLLNSKLLAPHQTETDKLLLKQQKADYIRKIKLNERVAEAAFENVTSGERVLAKRAIIQAQNDLSLDLVQQSNQNKLEKVAENIQYLYNQGFKK